MIGLALKPIKEYTMKCEVLTWYCASEGKTTFFVANWKRAQFIDYLYYVPVTCNKCGKENVWRLTPTEYEEMRP